MAYVSIRVTPRSTARTVVLEALLLLGCQVCMPLWFWLAWWKTWGSWGSRPDAVTSAPHRLRVRRASSWRRCSWAAGKVSSSLWSRVPDLNALRSLGQLLADVGVAHGAHGPCLSFLQSSGRCWRMRSPCSPGFVTSGRSFGVNAGPHRVTSLWPWPLPPREGACPQDPMCQCQPSWAWRVCLLAHVTVLSKVAF